VNALQAMGDDKLIQFGKDARNLAGIWVSGLLDPYKIQLYEARNVKRNWRASTFKAADTALITAAMPTD
jgi:hypothetical protein